MISIESTVTILASAVVFAGFNKFLEYGVIPIPKRYQGKDEHKWRSAATSLVHATVVGIMAVIRFVQYFAIIF